MTASTALDASRWDETIAELSADHRCVAPALPLGADLPLPGIARLVAEFLDRLNMHEVTLVGNDTGGALAQLLMAEDAARVVLVSCNAFDNFPPRLTGKTLMLSGKLSPAMFGLFMKQLRLRPARRLPIAFGWPTKRGDGATVRWLRPVMTRPEIRRDAVRTDAACIQPDQGTIGLAAAVVKPGSRGTLPYVAATRVSSLRSTATSWPGTGTRAGCLKG